MSTDTDLAAALVERRAALGPEQRAAMSDRLERAARFAGGGRIQRRAGDGPAPLSYAQQRLWFLDQLVPRNPFYNIPSRLRLGPVVDQRALERAMGEVVRRHEALRTSFAVRDDEPVQIVAPDLDVPLTVVDLRDAPPEQQERLLQEEAQREARRPFDLSSGPLVRTTLARTAHDNVLLLTMHHIVSDGWSMGVLLREFTAVYGAFAQGRPSPLAELTIQYPDFAAWQREYLTGDVLARHVTYWRQVLRDLPVLELPTDYARPPMPSFRGDNLPVRIPRDVSDGIRRLAGQLGATPFMVLLAGFATLLHRATGQDAVAIGVPIANRTEPQLEPLIGFFVNSLALRVDIDDTMTARDLVDHVRETALGAYAHQDLPFERLVDELQPERDLSRNPLAQVTIQLQNAPTATGRLPDDDDVGLDPSPGTSIVDVALSLWETTGSFVGMVQFSTDLFETATIEHLITAYTRVLGDIVENPNRAIGELELSSTADVVTWPRHPEPAGPASAPTLDGLIGYAADIRPDEIAVVDGDTSFTALAIDRWSAALAHRLRDLGVGRGDTVAVELPRCAAQVVAFLGVMRAGAAYVPIDPELPTARRTMMFDDAAVRYVIGESSCDPPRPGDLVVVDIGPCPAPDEPIAPPVVGHGPDDVAYVLFTSGSTGRPKGIRIPHRAIVNHMVWMQRRFPLGADDVVLQRTPAHFDASVWEFWAPIAAGARLVMHQSTHAADARAVCDALREHAVTVVQFVPSLLRLVVDEPRFERVTTLRRVYCGGEALPPALVRDVMERSDAELVNLYGPTEATIDATAWVCRADDIHRARVPVGSPIDGMAAEVIGADGRPTPIGMVGELELCGAGVADGYVADAPGGERFDGVAPYRRFRTGDLARRRPDGALEVLGRLDQQLKIRGNRIEPGEVEAVLVDHPAVGEVVVEASGSEDQPTDSLTAFVVRAADVAGNEVVTGADRTVLETAHVGRWLDLYGDVYQRPNPTDDATFDTVGWDSSYDLAPIDADAMRGWLDETLERIAELRPRRVLEIGAGTGLIALPVAPRCDRYLATDFSADALARLRAAAGDIDSLATRQVRADQLDSLGVDDLPTPVDLVVLNSVVQYFPSDRYLAQVLVDAGRRLAPGGHVFVGDVRNLQLLSAFHLSVALRDAPDSTPVRALRAEVRRRCHAESELVVDPRWFGTVGALDLVEIRPKATDHANELTMFRYDVVLRARPTDDDHDHDPDDDQDDGHDDDGHDDIAVLDFRRIDGELEATLRRHPGAVVITGVPNRRLSAWADADRLLDRLVDDDVATLRAEIGVRVAARPGIEPDAAIAVAGRCGREAVLLLDAASTDGSFDLLTWPTGSRRPGWRATDRHGDAAGGERLITTPIESAREAELGVELRDRASSQLPASMVPSRFVFLPALPRLPNGKLDRASLPRPDSGRRDSRVVAPTGPVEAVLADVWADLLGARRVSVTDHFFADLGGHSLLATQLIARIRELFDPELPLRLVFEAPTIASMATRLIETVPDAEHVAGVVRQVQDLSDDEVVASIARPSAGRSPT